MLTFCCYIDGLTVLYTAGSVCSELDRVGEM
jgi:hypothetical protein